MTSLVFLQQSNVKKSRKSMKFSGKTWLILILKVTKNQGFTLSPFLTLSFSVSLCLSLSRKHIFGKTKRWGVGWGSNWPPFLAAFLGLIIAPKATVVWSLIYMIALKQITNTEIFAFIAVLVFNSVSRRFLFITGKTIETVKKEATF